MSTQPGNPDQGSRDTVPDGPPVTGKSPQLTHPGEPQTDQPPQAMPPQQHQPEPGPMESPPAMPPQQYQPATQQPYQSAPAGMMAGTMAPPQAQVGNNMAVASLVLGIMSIVFSWWGLVTLAMGVLAIVFGVKGMDRANFGLPGKGMATAGLICGCVGLVAYVVLGIVTLGLFFLI